MALQGLQCCSPCPACSPAGAGDRLPDQWLWSDDTSMWTPGGLQYWLITGKFVFMIRDHICIHQEKANFTRYSRAPVAHTHRVSFKLTEFMILQGNPYAIEATSRTGSESCHFPGRVTGIRARKQLPFISRTTSRSSIRTKDPCFVMNGHSSGPCQAAFRFSRGMQSHDFSLITCGFVFATQ